MKMVPKRDILVWYKGLWADFLAAKGFLSHATSPLEELAFFCPKQWTFMMNNSCCFGGFFCWVLEHTIGFTKIAVFLLRNLPGGEGRAMENFSICPCRSPSKSSSLCQSFSIWATLSFLGAPLASLNKDSPVWAQLLQIIAGRLESNWDSSTGLQKWCSGSSHHGRNKPALEGGLLLGHLPTLKSFFSPHSSVVAWLQLMYHTGEIWRNEVPSAAFLSGTCCWYSEGWFVIIAWRTEEKGGSCFTDLPWHLKMEKNFLETI